VIVRLYFDDDTIRSSLVTALRARGIDILTANEAGMAGRLDEDHLAYATESGRVLCSFNRSDFYRIHTEYLVTGRSHAGLILAPQQRYPVGEYLHRILRPMATKSAEEMHNQVEFLSAWGEG
jgi:hypothetical protein